MPAEITIMRLSERKPTSPREFFERLYESDATTFKIKVDESKKDTTANSPDVLQTEISDPVMLINRNFLNQHPLVLRECYKSSITSPIFPNHCADNTPYLVDKNYGARYPQFPDRIKRKRNRRQRTTFTNDQTRQLETEYSLKEYISRRRRYELASSLRLTENQIKIWFQNRRAKDKRIEKAQQDQYCRFKYLERCIRNRGENVPNLSSLQWYDLQRIYIRQGTTSTTNFWNNSNASSTDCSPEILQNVLQNYSTRYYDKFDNSSNSNCPV